MFRKKEEVLKLREKFPIGARILLVKMDDAQAPPPGTLGTVSGVDDAGHILMSWDTGSSLSLIDGIDDFIVEGTV